MLAMFSPGPKSRTTAGILAVCLGWLGIHKFYLCYRDTGVVHIALTACGLAALLLVVALPDELSFVGFLVGWTLLILIYFYIRRYQLGHSMAQIISPVRTVALLLRRLVGPVLGFAFALVGRGSGMMGEEAEERRRNRRLRRGRRGRRSRYDDDDDDNDNDGCFSAGCLVIILGIVLAVAVVAVVILLFYVILILVGGLAGFLVLAASIAIGVAEGIIYLTKSDAEFERAYVGAQRLWF